MNTKITIEKNNKKEKNEPQKVKEKFKLLKDSEKKLLFTLLIVSSVLLNIYFLASLSAQKDASYPSQLASKNQEHPSAILFEKTCYNGRCQIYQKTATKEDLRKMELEFQRQQREILQEIEKMRKVHEALIQKIFETTLY